MKHWEYAISSSIYLINWLPSKTFVIRVLLSFFFILFPNMIIIRSLVACAFYIINWNHDSFFVHSWGILFNTKVTNALSVPHIKSLFSHMFDLMSFHFLFVYLYLLLLLYLILFSLLILQSYLVHVYFTFLPTSCFTFFSPTISSFTFSTSHYFLWSSYSH